MTAPATAPRSESRPFHRFIQCILLTLILPLLPLGLEFGLTGTVTSESITLVASMYAITIGVSSKYKTLLAFAIIVSTLFTAAYGSLAKERSHFKVHAQTQQASPVKLDPEPDSADDDFGNRMRRYSIFAIVVVFLVHAGERYVRHVVEREPFWDLV
jgi:hypothetical protein